MVEYIEYHPLKFWLDPASIAEIVAHIQSYLVANPINSTTEIETIIHDYLIAHPELIGGVDSVNGQTGEVVLTADNISAGENVTIKDVLDSLQDQIDDIVASIPSDYQQLINDVSDLKSNLEASYKTFNPYSVKENARFVASTGAIVDASGYCAVQLNVNPDDKLYISGATVGYNSTFTVILMNDDTFISALGVGDNYTPYFSIPYNVNNVRFTCTLNGYNTGALIVKKLDYDSIDWTIKTLVPYTNVKTTDSYRVTPTGTLVEAAGYYALEFDVTPNERIVFFRSLIGYNSTFNIVLLNSNGVVSVITDSGIAAQSGKYELVVPSNVTMIKATGSLNNKYKYNIFREIAVTDDTITGNEYTNKNGQTRYIVGNGYFPTIQSACDFADANDIIFIKSGTYNEAVSIWNKKLHLIGENRNTTFIVEHVGNYASPPLEMNIGSLSNITLIEDGADSASDTAETGKLGAYCLHIEAINQTTEVFEVDNCVFRNLIHAPLGCGLQANYTVRFRNCVFICEAADEKYANERGAFYVHTAVTTNPTGQHIIAENCIMQSANNIVVLLGVPSGATGSADYRFSGCTMWSAKRGIADNAVLFDTNSTDATFSKVQSYGNTIAVLNSN